MPDVLDVFAADSAFTMAGLTKTINQFDFVPNQLSRYNLFEEEGIAETVAWIEEDKQTLTLVKVAERGAPGDTFSTDKRKMRPFKIPHMPLQSSVQADEVQNLRAYAINQTPQAVLASVESVVNRKLSKARQRYEATLEYHKIGAVKGQILDADGVTVIYDLFTEFGVSQQTQAMALTTGTTNVDVKTREAIRLSQNALGNDPVQGWIAMCGDGFFDTFISHANVKQYYLQWQAAASLSGTNLAYRSFPVFGVNWENYRGSVGGVSYIGTDDAYLIPIGTPGLFIGRFGPSTWIDRVNQMPEFPSGFPIEVRQEMMPRGQGIALDLQSNPLYLCTKPRAIIKMTKV
jgi:hypothetical protein